MASFCRKCGKQAEEGGAFCAACGMSLTTPGPAQAPSQIPAAYTQPPAPPPGQQYREPNASAPPPGREKKKVMIWIPIAAIVVVLALAFCGLFFLTDIFKSGDDGSTVGGMTNTPPGETPGIGPTPGSSAPTTSTPESAPPATSTPETTPPETPTPETPPPETPTPETPTPDLPPNHISAAFLDVLHNGDNFYLSYMHYIIVGEQYGYVEHHEGIKTSSPEFVELARQGGFFVYRDSTWAYRWNHHFFHKDNKEYAIYHYKSAQATAYGREHVTVEDLIMPSSTGVSEGRLTFVVGAFSSHEYLGSGVGAVNGVQMPYDEYAVSLMGMDLGMRILFYMDGGTVVFLATYMDGEPGESFAFSEDFWADQPGSSFDIPFVGLSLDISPDKIEDMFDLDYYLEIYPVFQSDSPPSFPGR